ncbi:hypothetical protein [Ruegeria marina]|uniref:Uncharacterized protein n=1 Tax=Ruegeria marina TaxID=639004 RepID=A0A1G6LAZ3_9RHOB|nr:hypothetical protein [Ruegeria marina]SDC40401.1 hypothetical protein SAMN04488239_102195 [Ruegeria marina]
MMLLDLPFSSDYFLSFFQLQGNKPLIAGRTRDIAVMRGLVANGYGQTIANIRPQHDRAPDGRPLIIIPFRGEAQALPGIGPLSAKNRFYQVPHCNGGGYRVPSAAAAMRGIKAEGGWGVIFTEECEMHHKSEIPPSSSCACGRTGTSRNCAGCPRG